MKMDWDQFWSGAVLGLAAILAALTCRSTAGGWNDGSRLATVEALVDHHTWVIDDSIFVRPTSEANPYPYENDLLSAKGTQDKLQIDGRYYSDKSPVPAVLMAGTYKALQRSTELVAAKQPARFTLLMTLIFSGIPYVIAVWCAYLLGRFLGLSLSVRLTFTGAFALATMAPIYLQTVNNHILLLGVAMPLMLALAHLSRRRSENQSVLGPLLAVGALTGLGYTIDLGVGPVLLVCMSLYIVLTCRSIGALFAFALMVLPWLALHHVLNYSIGGSWKPANAIAEHLQWPGSPFNAENMTGAWKHQTGWNFVVYSLSLLFGKRGFMGHNLPLFLLVPGLWTLLRSRLREKPEVIVTLCWMVGTWLLYAAASNNYSGNCCSIRWFLPLLAPGFYLIALTLREVPYTQKQLPLLILGGVCLLFTLLPQGPWTNKMGTGFWVIQAMVLMGCLAIRRQELCKPEMIYTPQRPDQSPPQINWGDVLGERPGSHAA